MPNVRLEIDRKGVERYSDATFNPGDPLFVQVDGRDVVRNWVDGGDDPGVSVAQAEILRDLLEGGVVLEIGENGAVRYVEP